MVDGDDDDDDDDEQYECVVRTCVRCPPSFFF